MVVRFLFQSLFRRDKEAAYCICFFRFFFLVLFFLVVCVSIKQQRNLLSKVDPSRKLIQNQEFPASYETCSLNPFTPKN